MALRDVTLVLGPVVFQDFEIPACITVGSDQRLAVHDLPGGTRIIDALGPQPGDIAWSGVFGGVNATARAQLLDTLRAAGGVLILSWDTFFYTVVIRRFEADYHNAAWVPYRLTLTVLRDDAGALAQDAGNLLDSVLGDAGSAAGFAALAGISLAGLTAAIAMPGASTLGTATYLAASASLAAAQGSVMASQAGADATLGQYAAAGLGSTADVATMIGAAGDAAGLAVSANYLGRLGGNLNHAGS